VSTDIQLDTDWGPLSHPIRTEPMAADALPWRDNAFLAFWDPARDLYGTLHTSTSPNAEGRRARLSLQIGERVVELVEPLEPGTFTSASIGFQAGASFTVDSERITGEVHTAPLYALADYTGDRSPKAFNLDADHPLMHYQRAATVRGSLTVDGQEIAVDGLGFRDRTWGPRDESSSVNEYFGYQFLFDGCGVNAMKLRGVDGSEVTIGFLLEEGNATPLRSVALTRDASALFVASTLTFEDGRAIDVRASSRHAGFWCPMGWERSGPTLGAFDEFVALRTGDGREGFGLIEQGQVRQLY
jgi:hypothetical protein